jgi:hypothetical protein
LAFLTQHFYPLTRCGGQHPTIADLASAATRQREEGAIDGAVAAGRAAGVPVRLDETNSASCGGQDGVSNTLAAGLWMVDYLLLAASRGVAGVDVHGGLATCRGYSPLCVTGAGGPLAGTGPEIDPTADASLGAAAGQGPLAVQPDFYGLLLVHQLEGGRWVPISARLPRPMSGFALVMGDGSIRLVLDNPAPTGGARITIRAGGRRAVLGVLRLTGPSLAATSGVRLGGTSVAADGSWRPASGGRAASATDEVSVELAPASAAIVSLSPPA